MQFITKLTGKAKSIAGFALLGHRFYSEKLTSDLNLQVHFSDYLVPLFSYMYTYNILRGLFPNRFKSIQRRSCQVIEQPARDKTFKGRSRTSSSISYGSIRADVCTICHRLPVKAYECKDAKRAFEKCGP